MACVLRLCRLGFAKQVDHRAMKQETSCFMDRFCTGLVGVQQNGPELPRNKFRVRSEELVAAGGRDEYLASPAGAFEEVSRFGDGAACAWGTAGCMTWLLTGNELAASSQS